MKKQHIPWVVIPAVLLIDQVTKIVVKTTMTLGQSINVFGNWFQIHFTENYGMAFGIEFSGEYGKLMLSLFRIIAVVIIGFYLARQVKKPAHTGLIVCISLVMAGAIGNIIDSSFYGLIFSESLFNRVAEFMPEGGGYGTFLHGKVVDMLYFPIIQTRLPEWFPFRGGETFIFFRPVFNIADSAITTGVFGLIIFQKRFFGKTKKVDDPLETITTGEDTACEEVGPALDEPASERTDQALDEPVSEGDHPTFDETGTKSQNHNDSTIDKDNA